MNGLRILIVEDDNLIAMMLSGILKGLGHTIVATSATGAEAIAQMREEEVDLIFMDIRLRGAADGVETLARIKKELDADIPSIFVTGLTHEYKDPLLEADAYFLRKPFLPEDVVDAINAVIHSPATSALRFNSRA